MPDPVALFCLLCGRTSLVAEVDVHSWRCTAGHVIRVEDEPAAVPAGRRGSAGARRRRGAQTQRLVAEAFRDAGWPHATDAGAGRSGPDILGTPGLAVEVKARRELRLAAWLRQAARGREGLPIVVHRPDGAGPATVGDWPATLRLSDLLVLLARGGYSDLPGGAR